MATMAKTGVSTLTKMESSWLTVASVLVWAASQLAGAVHASAGKGEANALRQSGVARKRLSGNSG